MKRRLLILTEIIAPYRIPVFNALAARGDVELHVVFLAETDPAIREWRVYRDEIRFSHEVLPGWGGRVGGYRLLVNSGLGRALTRFRPEVVICGGYNYLASWQVWWRARRHGVPLLLWCESTLADARGGYWLVEALKRRFIANCDGFVVPGAASRGYLKALGTPERAITTAPNAVDTALFARAAEAARREETVARRRLALPRRFFLFVGRLVPEKGVFDLLESYSRLEPEVRAEVGLLYAGTGRAMPSLQERSRSIVPGDVRFAGFVQRESLPAYYALAEALVFPTHTDPWGLVVNEAMACGLPVIASDVAGSVADLVEDGSNGFVMPAGDVDRMGRCMMLVARDSGTRRRMGERSFERIAAYSPEACAAGLAQAALDGRRVAR